MENQTASTDQPVALVTGANLENATALDKAKNLAHLPNHNLY
jgi:hypothetical protein